MRLNGILILLAAFLLNAAASDLTGAWKVMFSGDPRTGPKTVGSIILDLKVDGNVVTGKVRIGSWPGEAPIADGRVENGHITFTATGRLDSTTGIPTCKLDVTMQGDQMRVTLTGLPSGRDYQYIGDRVPDYSLAKLTPLPRAF